MLRSIPAFILVVGLSVTLAPGVLARQEPPAPPSAPVPYPEPVPAPAPSPPSGGAPVRLFHEFVTDGTIQPNVWLEGQWRLENNAPLFDGDNGTRSYLTGILALGFGKRVEAGLTWGGIDVDPDQGSNNSGASDLEVYGKYLFRDAPLQISAGGLVKIPTADFDKGLGSGSADWEVFAGLRRDFGTVQAIGSMALRQNGDPDLSGVHGDASLQAGGGVIFELGKRSFGLLELSYETRRYEGLSSDLRLTPGFFKRLGERGFFRAAFGVGLTDGAPDTEAIVGFGWGY